MIKIKDKNQVIILTIISILFITIIFYKPLPIFLISLLILLNSSFLLDYKNLKMHYNITGSKNLLWLKLETSIRAISYNIIYTIIIYSAVNNFKYENTDIRYIFIAIALLSFITVIITEHITKKHLWDKLKNK